MEKQSACFRFKKKTIRKSQTSGTDQIVQLERGFTDFYRKSNWRIVVIDFYTVGCISFNGDKKKREGKKKQPIEKMSFT